MLTHILINTALTNKIEEALSESDFADVPILQSDISKPIERPSIKIIEENISMGKFNSKCVEKSSVFRIYYYARDKNEHIIENIEMQDLLESALLDDLKISEGFFIPIESLEMEVTDGVLVCTLETYAIELLPDNDTSEPMEEIIF